MSEDSIFLLHALLTGMFITLVYDGLIIVRRVIPHKPIAESLEDLGFWIFCAIYVFLWLYRESNGTLRWYAVASALLGMFVYKKTVSNFLVKGMVYLLKKMLVIVGRIFHVIMIPMGFLMSKVRRLHNNIRTHRRKIQGNLKIRLKSDLKAFKIKLTKE